VFTVWFSSVKGIEKFLAAHVRVKPIRWCFTPVHAAFTTVGAFSNPGKERAREATPVASTQLSGLRFWIHFLNTDASSGLRQFGFADNRIRVGSEVVQKRQCERGDVAKETHLGREEQRGKQAAVLFDETMAQVSAPHAAELHP
jgi:hypothetical protein